jgi:hypothetical protein
MKFPHDRAVCLSQRIQDRNSRSAVFSRQAFTEVLGIQNEKQNPMVFKDVEWHGKEGLRNSIRSITIRGRGGSF